LAKARGQALRVAAAAGRGREETVDVGATFYFSLPTPNRGK
jgi:hypothetical protein